MGRNLDYHVDHTQASYRVVKKQGSDRWVCNMTAASGKIVGRGTGVSPSQAVVSSQMDFAMRKWKGP